MLDLETYDFDKRRCANCFHAKLFGGAVHCEKGRTITDGRPPTNETTYSRIMGRKIRTAQFCADYELVE